MSDQNPSQRTTELAEHLRTLRAHLKLIEDGDQIPRTTAFNALLELDAIEKILREEMSDA